MYVLTTGVEGRERSVYLYTTEEEQEWWGRVKRMVRSMGEKNDGRRERERVRDEMYMYNSTCRNITCTCTCKRKGTCTCMEIRCTCT